MHPLSFSRRQILALTAAGGTQWCLSRRVEAAKGLAPLSFVIVSDTHLGRNDNNQSEKNWRRAIAEINEQPGEFVLHLGDIVDSGRKEQYPVYARTRTLLEKPIHEIPGNHDPVDLFEKHVAKKTDRAIDFGGVRFVLFNNSRRDSHDGFIDDEQIEWLEKQFHEAAQKELKVVVACHVPVHANKHPDRGWYVKPDNGQRSFYKLLERFSDQVLLTLHGHFHNGIRGWRDHGSTVETLIPSVCYNQNRRLSKHIADGKATGFFVDELRPGYVLASIGKGQLQLRYKPLGEDHHGEYKAEWS